MSRLSSAEIASKTAELTRHDSSVVSPQTAERIRTLGSEINRGIVADYGSFIPNDIRKRNADLGDRIVIIDDIERVRKEIRGIAFEGKTTNDLEMGCIKRDEGMTLILDPTTAWGKYSRPIVNPKTALERQLQRIHNAYLNRYGKDEQKARQAFEEDFFRQGIVHEFFHHYDAANLNPDVSEVPTIYYTAEFLKNHGMTGLNSIADLSDIQAYRNTITKFGNDTTRRWYFSSDVGFLKKRAIERAIRQHQALFLRTHPENA